MPNWCHNQLTVCGPVEDVRHFKEKAVGHSPWLPPERLNKSSPPTPRRASGLEILTKGNQWQIKNIHLQQTSLMR